MVLLRRALTARCKRGVAVAQIAADPRDEGDEKHRDQQETDEAALKIEPHRIVRSEEHTSELQSLMRISYAVFCLKKKKKKSIHMRQSSNNQQHKNDTEY